jgi:hypothetical protein
MLGRGERDTDAAAFCYPDGAVVRDRGLEQVADNPAVTDARWGILGGAAACSGRICLVEEGEQGSAFRC